MNREYMYMYTVLFFIILDVGWEEYRKIKMSIQYEIKQSSQFETRPGSSFLTPTKWID